MTQLTTQQHLPLVALVAMALTWSAASFSDDRADRARSDGVWIVESGDSLYRIAKRMFPDSRADRARLRGQLHALNPEAFRDNDPNKLRVDVQLSLPDFAITSAEVAEPETPQAADNVDAGNDNQAVSNTPAEEPEVVQAPAPVAEAKPELNLAGRVLFARGGMTARQSSGSVRSLTRNSDVYQGDTITTPTRGFGQVQLADGALLAIHPSTELVIEEFRYSGAEDGSESSVLRLIRGGFRTITGAIGKINKRNYRVNTLVATVGIRGTHYGLQYCEPACTLSDGTSSEGLFGGVADGNIAVGNNSGETGFTQSQYFRVDSMDEPPITLPGPPGIIFDGGELASGSAENDELADLLPDPALLGSVILDPTISTPSGDEILENLVRDEPNLGVEPTMPVEVIEPIPGDPPDPNDDSDPIPE